MDSVTALVNEADVFLQAYRPGGLEGKGFGVHDVVGLRYGIVYAGLKFEGLGLGRAMGCQKRRQYHFTSKSLLFFPLMNRSFSSHEINSLIFWGKLLQDSMSTTERDLQGFYKLGWGPVIPRPFLTQTLNHGGAHFLAFGINVGLCKTIIVRMTTPSRHLMKACHCLNGRLLQRKKYGI